MIDGEAVGYMTYEMKISYNYLSPLLTSSIYLSRRYMCVYLRNYFGTKP